VLEFDRSPVLAETPPMGTTLVLTDKTDLERIRLIRDKPMKLLGLFQSWPFLQAIGGYASFWARGGSGYASVGRSISRRTGSLIGILAVSWKIPGCTPVLDIRALQPAMVSRAAKG